jgi:methylated-DNA-[protein]-cysteine S-methyltransferase
MGERRVVAVFRSDLGWMGLCWAGGAAVRLVFGHASPEQVRKVLWGEGWIEEMQDEEGWSGELACAVEELRRYAAGEKATFSAIATEGRGTEFQRRVWRECRQIPYGMTLSYGQLARRSGEPLAARAVGRAMATNPLPLLVPCHRVLASGGRIGGYSAPGGLALKRQLLALEGVDLGALGRRVDSPRAAG